MVVDNCISVEDGEKKFQFEKEKFRIKKRKIKKESEKAKTKKSKYVATGFQ